jgi:type I restriction enzyme M protein
VRLYRGEKAELTVGGSEMLTETFPDKVYRDVAGLCKIATLDEIEARGLEETIAENVAQILNL